jgi:Protein of unknown function (DUF3102)
MNVEAKKPPQAGDNWLRDAAGRIDAEHEAATAHFANALEHAVTAGELLIEAKTRLGHGQWLGWLRTNCRVPERTAQHYMRLARRIGKSAKLADLTVSQALDLIAEPRPVEPPSPVADFDEVWEWAEAQIQAPFTDWDFEIDRNDHLWLQWLSAKILTVAEVPAAAAICLQMADEYGHDTVALAPFDEAVEAVRLLALFAKGERAFPLSLVRSDPLMAGVTLKMITQRLIGGIICRFDRYRNANVEKIGRNLLAQIDQRLAAPERERRRHERNPALSPRGAAAPESA